MLSQPGGEGCQVDGFGAGYRGAGVEAGEEQQVFGEGLEAAGLSCGGGGRGGPVGAFRVGERDFQAGQQCGEGAAQFVGGVRDEAALLGGGVVEALEGGVDGGGQGGDLVSRGGDGDTFAGVARGDRGGEDTDGFDRPQRDADGEVDGGGNQYEADEPGPQQQAVGDLGVLLGCVREHHHIDPQLCVGGDAQSSDFVAAEFIRSDIGRYDLIDPTGHIASESGVVVAVHRKAHEIGRPLPGWSGQHVAGAGTEGVHASAVGDSGAPAGSDDLVRHGASASGNHTFLQLVGESPELIQGLFLGDLRVLAVDVMVDPPADAGQDDRGCRGGGQGRDGPYRTRPPPAASRLSRVHGRPPAGSRYPVRSAGTAGGTRRPPSCAVR